MKCMASELHSAEACMWADMCVVREVPVTLGPVCCPHSWPVVWHLVLFMPVLAPVIPTGLQATCSSHTAPGWLRLPSAFCRQLPVFSP